MMDIYYHFRLGPLRIYITNRRMKSRGVHESLRHRNKSRLGYLRRDIYRKNGGCCQACGRHYDLKRLELHHVIPINVRPDLINKRSNVRLLCHKCHLAAHGKPL